MKSLLATILFFFVVNAQAQQTKIVNLSGGVGGAMSPSSYLRSLPGWSNDPSLSLRANMTWQTSGGTALTQLGTPTMSLSNAAATSVTLNWTSVPNATSYTLEYYTGTEWANLYTGNSVLFNAVGLAANTTYQWRVRATANGYMESNNATISYATPATGGANNLMARSHNFATGHAIAGMSSVDYGSATNGGVLAPDGSDDVTRFVLNSPFASSRHAPGAPYTHTSSTPYTYWVDFRAGTATTLEIQLNLGNNVYIMTGFNGSTGVATKIYEDVPTVVGMTDLGGGWYRGTMSFTTPASAGADVDVTISPRPGSEGGGQTIWVWRNQINTGTTPTTYVPKP